MCNKKAQSLSPQLGSRLCVFTSGSFAFFHFQLHYINLCLFFTSGTIEWKVEHHRISIHFGSCLGITDRAVNPSGILFIFTHKITSSIAYALRGNVGLLQAAIFDPGECRTEVGSGAVKVFFNKQFQQCVLDFFFWDQRLNNSILVFQYASL